MINYSQLTGSDTGDSAITEYELVWDNGSGSFATTTAVVQTETPTFTYQSTQTSGFTVGTTYLFKYRAKNQYGYGDYSPELSVMAGAVPDQLSAVTTSLTAGGLLQIDWNPTSNDHSLSVTEYLVAIKDDDSATYTAHADCDGTSGTVVSNTLCTVTMSDMGSAPYNYEAGDLIIVQVSAKNVKGWSTVSADNGSGQVYVVAPTAGPSLS